VAPFGSPSLADAFATASTKEARRFAMKIKVTNTQTIELPDDMDPEDAAALFQNPGAEEGDDFDDEDDGDRDEAEDIDDEGDEG
jgi:hypothetical protein